MQVELCEVKATLVYKQVPKQSGLQRVLKKQKKEEGREEKGVWREGGAGLESTESRTHSYTQHISL